MLIEPVALSDFFLSFFTGAMIILVAALYAGLFAWAKITNKNGLNYWSWLAYIVLLICVAKFTQINHFSGHWLWLSFIMVFGYWWMPRLIWRLCVLTHSDEVGH
jgi:hypothetical protein